MEKSDTFGDISGVGAGRNWAHVNSVDYDPTDDSIIISSRHQSAIIKIGRDKKVKWILSAPDGWKGDLAKKVLKPIDKDGSLSNVKTASAKVTLTTPGRSTPLSVSIPRAIKT